ncbi:MAG: NUDIX hydrolase [bacterium]
MSDEPTVSSRLVFRGQVATVRVDEVRLPSGRIGRREIIEHPGAAAIVALTDASEVVLVRQYRKTVERTLLEIPAGKLEPGESPLACAQRELAEETGLQADEMTPLVTFVPSPGILTEAITVFLARGLAPHRVSAPVDEEGLRVERVPLEHIHGLIAAGEILDGKSLVGLLLTLSGRARNEPARGGAS